jgi:segregation and condensation protein A
MLENNTSKESVIVTFLVMLELIKTGIVEVVQAQTCGDIDITVVGNPQDMGEMEEA